MTTRSTRIVFVAYDGMTLLDLVGPFEVLSLWPQAEVLRLPGCGHYVLEDAPEEIGQAIETFLAAHPVAVRG